MALIVAAEDDADVAELLTTTLTRAGHVVHVAGTGPRALQMVTERHPDLVILDHNMPGMTGLDVGRRLRADAATAELPMLMISAAAPEGAQEVFDHVMQMPVGLSSVAEAAADLLAAGPRGRSAAGRALTDPQRLAAVAARLGNPDPVDELTLTMVLANVAEAAGARTVAAGLVLNDTVLTVGAVGLPELISDAGGLPVEWTPAGMVVGADRPVLMGDMRADTVFRHTPMAVVCGIRSYAAVPLRADDGMVIGVLTAMDTEPDRFTPDTVRGLLATTPTVMTLVDRRLD